MIDGTWAAASRMPKRIVVELDADEYRTLEAACRDRRVTAPELIRVAALKLARSL